MSNGYELENAYRKMRELHDEAAQDAMVQEVKKAKRKQGSSSWYSLVWRNLLKLGKRPARATRIKSTYGKQITTCEDE